MLLAARAEPARSQSPGVLEPPADGSLVWTPVRAAAGNCTAILGFAAFGLAVFALACALSMPRIAAAQNQTQVTVSGVGYAQYGYLLKDTANHVNTFDITRAYVNLIGRFAGGVGARVTLDVNRPAGDNSLRYRLKYAFATYTPVNSPLAAS